MNMISQTIKKNGTRGLVYLLLIPLLSMASCVKEHAINDPNTLPEVPEGMVRIGLYTNSGDYQTPVTRKAADENSVYGNGRMPWVFVFVGNDDNAVFAEVKQATPGVDDAPPSVVLKQQSSAVRVLIVANAPATFFNGAANVAFTESALTDSHTGKTFDEAVNGILNTVKLSNPQMTVPYDGEYLPMTGKYDLAAGIDTETSIGTSGNEVQLTRVVAKVTVTNSASGFKLSTVSVAGVKQYGRLYQTTPVTPMTANGSINFAADIVTATGTAGNGNTDGAPLYIYESAAGETSVIVKGTYSGTTGYYRLAFKSKNNADIADGTIMDVQRNKHYKFEITKVTGSGFGSVAEAIAAPPSNNITATITVTELSSHDIIDNGQYYLGVSNSEFIAYSDDALSGIEAVTVTTNATSTMIGSTNTVTAATTNGSGLSVSPSTLTLAGKTTLKINLPETFTTSSTGTITITLGNLKKTIKVTRRASLGAGASVTEFKNEYAAGEIVSQGDGGDGWLSLSLDGETSNQEVTRLDGAGSLYLMTTKNIAANGTSPRKDGEVYLYRHNGNGRVKLYIAQINVDTESVQVVEDNDITMNRYVGAFWRWNERGERVIRMGNQSYVDANGGPWTATVIVGEEWIILAAGGSADKNIYKASPGNAESFKLGGNATSVSGNYTSTTKPILFRIGLQSEHPNGALAGINGSAVPRYGVILLEYGTPVKYHKIYVRQGEAAAAIVGGTTRWAVYNVGNYANPTQYGGDNGFVAYPSQAGYFKHWSPKTTMYSPIENGTMPQEGYASIATAICPSGYNIPNSTGGLVWSTSNQMGGLTHTGTSSVWGYYADGFFDRRTIGRNPTAAGSTNENCAVDNANTSVAYVGRLFVNTYTSATVFLPAAGHRDHQGGLAAGSRGAYWSRTFIPNTDAWAFSCTRVEAAPSVGWTLRYAYSVRCCK